MASMDSRSGLGSESGSGDSVGGIPVKESWWKKYTKFDRKMIASMGTSMLLSYGFISNVAYVSSLIIAVYSAMVKVGASPLTSPEAFKYFATVYAGLWVFHNFIRPARIAISMSIGFVFDNLVDYFNDKFPGRPKWMAFFFTVFVVNVCGTFVLLFGGLQLVTMLTGVPMGWENLFSFFSEAKKAKDALIVAA